MACQRSLLLSFGSGKTTVVDSLFKFGRSNEGFNHISDRISRVHFTIEPLQSMRADGVCARLVLKGSYLCVASSASTCSSEKVYQTKGETILIRHQDKLCLEPTNEFSLTVLDRMLAASPKQKRKRSSDMTLNALASFPEPETPSPKRRKSGSNGGVVQSMCFKYNNNNNSAQKQQQQRQHLGDDAYSFSPSRLSAGSVANSNNGSLFLGTPRSDRSPSRRSLTGDVSPSPNKAHRSPSTPCPPMAAALQQQQDEEKHHIANDDDDDASCTYSLALPLVDLARHKFDSVLGLAEMTKALSEFMSTHKHPQLRIIVLLGDHDRDTFVKALAYNDRRIVIHNGALSDIETLECRYIVNWTFWDFSPNKGERLNKLIHSQCDTLCERSRAKYKTAKHTMQCYDIELNRRMYLQIRLPSLNPKMHEYVAGKKQQAYRQLHDTYSTILTTFYTHCGFMQPTHDSFIKNDVAKWKTQQDDDGDVDVLHFSLQSVPCYSYPRLATWPECGGGWRNQLSAYITAEERDDKFAPCVFYEDRSFVVIYDRFPKARVHLLLIPKCKLRDLGQLDESHEALLSGMIARAKWIKHGLLDANESISNIKYGFHAIPSLSQLHCHIISTDMDSACLKNKKHFHSFMPGYFIAAQSILRLVRNKEITKSSPLKVNKEHYQQLLKSDLRCPFCEAKIKTLPAMKRHMKQCLSNTRSDAKSDDEITNDTVVVQL